MAGVNLEPHHPAPPTRPLELQLQDAAVALIAVLGITAVAQPGVLAGALLTFGWWQYSRFTVGRPPLLAMRLGVAAVALLELAIAHGAVQFAWAVALLLHHVAPQVGGHSLPATAPTLAAVCAEALLGPIWFEGVLLATRLRGRRIGAAVVRDHRRDTRRFRALTGKRSRSLSQPLTSRAEIDTRHPDGRIRLGLDTESGRPFDLDLRELTQHVFLPGASGAGKTTTLTRLADGALASGYGLVLVDCKGGGLGGVARELARRHGLAFNLVDPDAFEDAPAGEKPLGYNPCWGDAASVGNKLVGAFTYTGNAEVYKDVALEAIPLIVRALIAAGRPVTLDALYDTLGKGGMAALASKVEQPLRGRLEVLDRSGGVGQAGYVGLQRRFGALREGKFGELFSTPPALDWDEALSAPSVTYIVLRATASSEDVDLMGRLVAQDLKQACARRFRMLERGEQPVPVLAVFDEFAALREAEQIVDLLLQARQALMPTVVSVQYLPESIPIRGAVLGAGLLIAHRVAGDAEAIAGQFGTRRATELTNQIDFETGYAEKGSVRTVDQYVVHPNALRNLQPGQAAVRSVPSERNAVVQVFPTIG